MTRSRYTRQEALAAGEVTTEGMSWEARYILNGLGRHNAIERTNRRRSYWVNPGVGAYLGLKEPPGADDYLNQEARSARPNMLWVPVADLLAAVGALNAQTIGDAWDHVHHLAHIAETGALEVGAEAV